MRTRWLVLSIWLALTIAGGVFGGQVFDKAAPVDELSASAEAMRAEARLDEIEPEGTVILAVTKDREPFDPELVASVTEVTKALAGIAKVESIYNTPGGGIGRDTKSTLIRAELLDPRYEEQVIAELRKIKAPRVLVGGQSVAEKEFADQAVRDAALGESVAIAVLIVLLFVIFRRTVPVLIVMGAALASITVTLLVLRGLAEVTTVSEFALNVVTLLGLGLTVDYALLMVWRYREDGSAGRVKRTVLISGAAIALSLAALMVFGEPLLASMALGGLAAAVVSTAVALTLVPMLINLGAKRIPPATKPTFTLLPRLASYALGRPGPVAFGAVVVLLLLSLPFLGVNVRGTDARILPAASEARQVYEEVLNTFRHGRPEPVVVIVERDATGAEMRDYLNKLNQLDGVALMEPRIEMPPNVTVIDLIPDSEAVAQDVVRAARAVPVNASVLVGGTAAETVDYRDSVLGKLPLVLAVLFAVMLGLLFLLTGSLIIPVKAFLLNLLPLAASLGVLTLVFGTLDMTTPVLLFVFIFGLSMDYEVFLLARITEAYRSTKDNDGAILKGIVGTGPVVTAAAACLVVVFLGFLLGELAPVKEIGLGMAVALIIDVTIVRGLLLPSVMKLLGGWNWWPGGRSVGGHDPR
ncbi:MMPL family transporter [Catelliglobosispora koreensis]|uniref:MMPL family transporter n=1 Tax=Catelliglobosispora koreensis TaxID=129052 RepID=UPI0003675414|nr:MMPL family transporter [Catelliglobosispora koreensis]